MLAVGRHVVLLKAFQMVIKRVQRRVLLGQYTIPCGTVTELAPLTRGCNNPPARKV